MAERDAPIEEELPPDDPELGDEPEPQDDPDPDELDGDPEPDPDAEPGGEPAPEPQRTKKSARDRVQDAIRERDAATARAAAAEQERDAARHAAQQRDQRDAAAAETAEDERVMRDLDENGRVQYLLAKKLKATETTQQSIQQRLADSDDRVAFAEKWGADPRVAKMRPEIEAAFRRCPPGTTREAVFFIMLGRRTATGDPAPARRSRQQAQERVAAQRAPGTGAARSDVRPRGGARSGNLVQRMERDDPLI